MDHLTAGQLRKLIEGLGDDDRVTLLSLEGEELAAEAYVADSSDPGFQGLDEGEQVLVIQATETVL